MSLNTGIGIGSGLTAVAQAQTTLKIGDATKATSRYGVGSTTFCEEIEKGTQNRYKCQQLPSSALGGEREMIEDVQPGTLDMVNTYTGPVGNFMPKVKIVDIPFLFREYDHARKVMDGPIGKDILTKFAAKGSIALGWTENGFRHMTNNKQDIVKPADGAVLKMRNMENKVHMDGYKTFGILPTPMAFPELFGTLQQGTVDVQEDSIPVILVSKFAQVQKHLLLTGHVYSPALLLMSPTARGKLNDADKNVFSDTAKKAAVTQRKKVNDGESTGKVFVTLSNQHMPAMPAMPAMPKSLALKTSGVFKTSSKVIKASRPHTECSMRVVFLNL